MARLKAAVFAAITLIILIAMSSLPRRAVKDTDATVGMSLSPTYGTVAIRNDDGSFTNVARIDGSPEYIELMKRLSRLESIHPSPPYRSGEEMWDDIPRQLLRRSRKGVGLAASGNVAIISNLLKDLKAAAERHLAVQISATVVAYPRLAALYEEEVRDAGDYLGLGTLEGHHFHQPHELVAAYAGHGMGLCEHPLRPSRCRDEEANLPSRDVLSVYATGGTFVISFERVKEAFDLAKWDLQSEAEFDQQDVSAIIGDAVRNTLDDQFMHLKKPSEIHVIFSGKDGGSKAIQTAVTSAIADFGVPSKSFAAEPDFIAARGAAELAWRAHAPKHIVYTDDLR